MTTKIQRGALVATMKLECVPVDAGPAQKAYFERLEAMTRRPSKPKRAKRGTDG
jgi:hypothetical protein